MTYDPDADCDLFHDFLRQAMDGRRELVMLLQEILGYCLVPDNRHQKAFLHIGRAGNGKSTFLNVQRAVVGPENCSAVTLHDLADNRFASAELYGKLINGVADLSSRELSSSALFRAITGGDPINAERKGAPLFSFVPYVRLCFSANKFPTVRDPTRALFDRWIVIPWDVRFRDATNEDKALKDKLTAPDELSGILNFALRGLMRLNRRGHFRASDAAQGQLDRFRQSANLVGVFLEDTKREAGWKAGKRIKRGLLFDNYVTWCDRTEHKAMGRNTFYDRVEDVLSREPVKTAGGDYEFVLD